MASNDTNLSRDSVRAYPPVRPASSASTWYLVIGAAVLLMVLYLMTTGLMRNPLPADAVVPGSETVMTPAEPAAPSLP